MLYFGACTRKLEPEIAKDNKDKGMDHYKVWKVFCIPMQGCLIAHLVYEAILLKVQVVP